MSVTVANEGCNQVGNERAIGILLLGRVNTGYVQRMEALVGRLMTADGLNGLRGVRLPHLDP